MVNEHTGQLLTDCLGQHDRRNRGIHPAGKRTKHLPIANLFPQRLNRGIYE